jgi:hypothetical protein
LVYLLLVSVSSYYLVVTIYKNWRVQSVQLLRVCKTSVHFTRVYLTNNIRAVVISHVWRQLFRGVAVQVFGGAVFIQNIQLIKLTLG